MVDVGCVAVCHEYVILLYICQYGMIGHWCWADRDAADNDDRYITFL